MADAMTATEDTEFVTFWNEVLAPKFIRFKHVLVDGLTQHSEAIQAQRLSSEGIVMDSSSWVITATNPL